MHEFSSNVGISLISKCIFGGTYAIKHHICLLIQQFLHPKKMINHCSELLILDSHVVQGMITFLQFSLLELFPLKIQYDRARQN